MHDIVDIVKVGQGLLNDKKCSDLPLFFLKKKAEKAENFYK
jgi:hypothetical protein